jgi:hypothetical protein
VEKASVEVRLMCDVFDFSPSAYYEWEREQRSERGKRDSELLVL